jgi:uncharacterized membrane protein SpoIIM required for sporulation
MRAEKVPRAALGVGPDSAAGGQGNARLSELERLVQRVSSLRAERLTLAQSARLATLYRWGASELLRARASDSAAPRTEYLEGLLRAAYVAVYGPVELRRPWGVRRLFLRDFPRLVRAELPFVLLAAFFIALGTASGALVVSYDPSALSVVVPELHQDQTPVERVRQESERETFDAGGSAVFSSFLFTHNIQVTFLVFALGLSFGLGTALVLFWNGIPLGALAAQYLGSGQGSFFFAWILPHGVIELTVVAIAGAAGFVIARGLLRPSPRSRARALQEEAKRAVTLVMGGMPLLVVAGLVEGSISQLHPPLLPLSIKLSAALCLALANFAYLGLAGRDEDPAEAELA